MRIARVETVCRLEVESSNDIHIEYTYIRHDDSIWPYGWMNAQTKRPSLSHSLGFSPLQPLAP